MNWQLHFNVQEIKNSVPFSSQLNSFACFSFFGVRNLKAVEGTFMFSPPKFDLFLFYLIERRASATYNISQANWVVFCWFYKCQKNCHFWSCSISNSFVEICDIYLGNSLLNFYFGFDLENPRYPFIFLHFLLCLSYKITRHLLNAHEVKYASFHHCRKWSPILFVVKIWYSILIETINKSVKGVLRYRIYRKLLPM